MLLRHVAKALRLVPFGLVGMLGASCSDTGFDGELEANVARHSEAITLPTGFTDQVIASGMPSPTALAFAPDGRIFVAQQAGQLRVVKNGSLLATPFVSLTVNSSGERGLLGVTFHPNFTTNGFVYLYYTATTPSIHNRVSRFTANGDVALAGSEVVLFDLPTLSATNHNGGALTFGPDGKLYVAVGENAVGSNAQSLSTPLGKILRFNADGSIPSDNPFFGSTTGINRSIWALGLRNPFTFAFQPGTGRFFLNDVGQNAWEEINDGIVASNYGWPETEGTTTDPDYRSPLFAYGHGSSGTTGCAITGGAFYNPGSVNFPSSYLGKYFFADYCSNWIRVFDPAAGTASAFATALSSPVDLDVGPDGRLYYLMRGSGGLVGAIGFSTGQAPSITTHPANQTVSTGQTATFSVAATGSQPLGYQWQRGTTNIAGATGSSYSLVTAAGDNGATFRVVVSNGFGSVTSNSATLTVTTNAPPVATITAPSAGTIYRGGDTITYAGTGTDAETGNLPASAFTWEVVFHHATHTHPFLGPVTGVSSGSFTIPRTGEMATNVWYRIHLTVRDPAGLTHTTTRDILPELTQLSFASNPSGLGLTLDGIPLTTPTAIDSVVGMTRTLGAPSPQTLGGTNYAFSAWSDGGAATHDINAPVADTTYTATYTPTASGGLSGQYFDNINFTTPRLTRVDSTVNFDWASASPDPSIGSDTFSVRWTGTITPRFSQAYTLYTTSDDGIRVTFNGAVLIDNLTDHPPTENSGVTPVLNAGQAYPIQIDYYENGGGAVARLSWSSASEPKQIVPATQLSPVVPSAFPIRINFQLAGAATPSGYLADTGLLFGDRGGGRSYGWSLNTTDVCRDRGVNSNQLLDTLCHFHAGAAWELLVPNGTYNVLVSIGDPSFASTHTVIVEGTTYWNALSLAANQFSSATNPVTVSDGRLTITQGSAADKATRINYLEVLVP